MQEFCFLSWNAGAARLLVPDTLEKHFRDLHSVSHMSISKHFPETDNNAFEMLFNNSCDERFCLEIADHQSDRADPVEFTSGPFPFLVWSKHGLLYELAAYYRHIVHMVVGATGAGII